MILARCPECATTFRVRPEQLRARQGHVRCGKCQHPFNALETLVDEGAALLTHPTQPAHPSPPPQTGPALFVLEEKAAAEVHAPDAAPALEALSLAEEFPPPPEPEATVLLAEELAPNEPMAPVFEFGVDIPDSPAADVPLILPFPDEEDRHAPPEVIAEDEWPLQAESATPIDDPLLPVDAFPANSLDEFSADLAPSPEFEPFIPLEPAGSALQTPPLNKAPDETLPAETLEALPLPHEVDHEFASPRLTEDVPEPAPPIDIESLMHTRDAEQANEAFAVAAEPAAPPPVIPLPPAGADQAEEEDPSDDKDEDAPEASRHPGLNHALWAAAATLLGLGVLAQGVLVFRNEIALSSPQMRPALESLCAGLGCDLPLPRHAADIAIESSDIQPDANREAYFTLHATLRNRADFQQAWPHVEITLTDARDKALVRRVLAPAEWLPAGTPKDAFPARGETAIRVAFEARGVAAAGYRVYAFYP